jgi:pimeloyl-ACP methyl ester carboxylesterase
MAQAPISSRKRAMCGAAVLVVSMVALGLVQRDGNLRGRRRDSVPQDSRSGRWTDRSWDGDVREFDHRGARLRYLDHGAGPTLVLLHGMACCWQWWLECIPELAEHYRVIAVDLPGFGDSDPLPAPASMEEYADAVVALVEGAGIERVAVAGHSMGGLVAARMAMARPDLVARLVLVDAGGVPMSERRLHMVLKVLRVAHAMFTYPAMLDLLASNRGARRRLLRGAMADPDAMSDELAAVVVPRLNAPAFVDAIAASARAVRDSRPEEITVPTGLIWGERDVFAPVHTAEQMLARLPNGRLDVMPGVGHSPMVESPRAFCALLHQHAAHD